MSGVNFDGLTRAEEAEYFRLGDFGKYRPRERRAVLRPVLPLLGAWTAVSTFFLISGAVQATQGHGSVLVAVGLGLLWAGLLTLPFHARRMVTRGTKSRQAAFLTVARDRARQASPVEHLDFRYVSERQRQHEWYGDHADLDWRDRKIAEMYGMDADSYKSNFQGD